jgi:hypothetical protein
MIIADKVTLSFRKLTVTLFDFSSLVCRLNSNLSLARSETSRNFATPSRFFIIKGRNKEKKRTNTSLRVNLTTLNAN